jgi:hypothetical protein
MIFQANAINHFVRACEMLGGELSTDDSSPPGSLRACVRDAGGVYIVNSVLPSQQFARACEMQVEVIPDADHFQNAWKSNNHFQRLASG